MEVSQLLRSSAHKSAMASLGTARPIEEARLVSKYQGTNAKKAKKVMRCLDDRNCC